MNSQLSKNCSTESQTPYCANIVQCSVLDYLAVHHRHHYKMNKPQARSETERYFFPKEKWICEIDFQQRQFEVCQLSPDKNVLDKDLVKAVAEAGRGFRVVMTGLCIGYLSYSVGVHTVVAISQ